MTTDFKASQVQTNRLIATGSFAGGSANQILVYSIDADDPFNPNQGQIEASAFDVTSGIGSDVLLFVSGGIGQARSPGSYAVSVFGGDTVVSGVLYGSTGQFSGDFVVSGTLYAERQVIEVDELATGSLLVSGNLVVSQSVTSGQGLFVNTSNESGYGIVVGGDGSFVNRVTGSLEVTSGLSGSLTQLTDGSSYLVAGSNILITSQSNGSVLIEGTTPPTPSYWFERSLDLIYTTGSVEISGSLTNGLDVSIIGGQWNHAEGVYTLVGGIGGQGAHSEGLLTTASNDFSHSEGVLTVAAGYGSHAEGLQTNAVGSYSHTEGHSTVAQGQYSHTEGFSTTTSGDYSHAEGDGSAAIGYASHAEGDTCGALGYASHAEGAGAGAFGSGSHAEGHITNATGDYSHAEGYGTVAVGDYSHTEGFGTIASGSYQHVQGTFNLRNNDFSLFVIGDGIGPSDPQRSDIVRVNSGSAPGLGRVEITGSLAVSGSNSRLEVGEIDFTLGSDVGFFVSGSIGDRGVAGSNTSVFGGDLVVSGNTHHLAGISLYVTQVISTTPAYTASLTDYVVAVSASAGLGITLPPSPGVGKTYIIKDVSGSAATDNIVVSGTGGELIDGQLGEAIAIDYGSIQVVYFGAPIGWGIV